MDERFAVPDFDSDERERTICGLNKEQWMDRFIAYMMKHSNSEYWQAEESADVAWDMSDDEDPEECAAEELSYWE